MPIQQFESSLPMMLYRALDVVMPRFRAIFREFELTEQQWRVLRVLWEQREAPARDLAASALIPPPSLVGIVDRLERRGLVTRRRDPDDRRGVFIGITKDGQQLKWRVLPRVDAAYQEMKDGIDPAVWQQVLDGLERICELQDSPSEREEGNPPASVPAAK